MLALTEVHLHSQTCKNIDRDVSYIFDTWKFDKDNIVRFFTNVRPLLLYKLKMLRVASPKSIYLYWQFMEVFEIVKRS